MSILTLVLLFELYLTLLLILSVFTAVLFIKFLFKYALPRLLSRESLTYWYIYFPCFILPRLMRISFLLIFCGIFLLRSCQVMCILNESLSKCTFDFNLLRLSILDFDFYINLNLHTLPAFLQSVSYELDSSGVVINMAKGGVPDVGDIVEVRPKDSSGNAVDTHNDGFRKSLAKATNSIRNYTDNIVQDVHLNSKLKELAEALKNVDTDKLENKHSLDNNKINKLHSLFNDSSYSINSPPPKDVSRVFIPFTHPSIVTDVTPVQGTSTVTVTFQSLTHTAGAYEAGVYFNYNKDGSGTVKELWLDINEPTGKLVKHFCESLQDPNPKRAAAFESLKSEMMTNIIYKSMIKSGFLEVNLAPDFSVILVDTATDTRIADVTEYVRDVPLLKDCISANIKSPTLPITPRGVDFDSIVENDYDIDRLLSSTSLKSKPQSITLGHYTVDVDSTTGHSDVCLLEQNDKTKSFTEAQKALSNYFVKHPTGFKKPYLNNYESSFSTLNRSHVYDSSDYFKNFLFKNNSKPFRIESYNFINKNWNYYDLLKLFKFTK